MLGSEYKNFLASISSGANVIFPTSVEQISLANHDCVFAIDERLISILRGSLDDLGFIGRKNEEGTPAYWIGRNGAAPHSVLDGEFKCVHFEGAPDYWIGRNFAAQPSVPGDGKFKCVCFHTTDELYTRHAKRLKSSLQHHDIDFEINAVDMPAFHELICARKASFIRDKWRNSDRSIAWLDADATVEQYPVLFTKRDVDLAVHKWNGWKFGGGTLFFGKSDATGALLDNWVARCESDPTTSDQVHLQSAWIDINAQMPLRTLFLPRSYLQIFDAPASEPPVIQHWQASREAGNVLHGYLGETKRGKADRRLSRIWRTQAEEFWISNSVNNIIPNAGVEFPEGFDVAAALKEAIGPERPIVELGCGVGRIASLFDPSEYIGCDISPAALATAKISAPNHQFRLIDKGICLPKSPCLLLYAVLLHINDANIFDFVQDAIAGRKRIVVAEIMDRRWRPPGKYPSFNRDVEDYVLLFQSMGWQLSYARKHRYAHYDVPSVNQGRDSRLTVLAFEPQSSRPETLS